MARVGKCNVISTFITLNLLHMIDSKVGELAGRRNKALSKDIVGWHQRFEGERAVLENGFFFTSIFA